METQEQINYVREISPNEIRLAHKLGVAFGHLWATRLEVEEVIGLSPDQIRALVLERTEGESNLGGIYSPWMNEDFAISHATGTGRVTWEIWGSTDGDGLTVEVHRLTGRVIALEVNLKWTSETEFKIAEVILRDIKPCGSRHLEAAADVLYALGATQGRGLPDPLWQFKSVCRQWDLVDGAYLLHKEVGQGSPADEAIFKIAETAADYLKGMVWEHTMSRDFFLELKKGFWDSPTVLSTLVVDDDDEDVDPYADFDEVSDENK